MNSMPKMNRTYYIVTIGCQMNRADSERLSSFLLNQGFRLARDSKKASLVIFNTCGVRQMAEDRVYGLVNNLRHDNPKAKIVIAGCLSRRPDVQKRLAGKADLFLPINEMLQLPDFFRGEGILPHFSLEEVRRQQGEKYLSIKPQYESRFTAYIPIGNGCDNFCAYCVVPYARGREVYRPAREIIREARELVNKGYKEIFLIAQNVNSYHDKRYDFPSLLLAVSSLKGDFWLRFSSSHPKDMSPALITALASSKKICPHLHLAVQSGDDEILKKMNRRYTAAHYLKLIRQARRAKPGLAITTDVIVGFPGETKKQFENTAKLFRSAAFDMAYIAEYSPRPGTASCLMADNVSHTEKGRRAQALNDILRKTALGHNQEYIGKVAEVLVEGQNKWGKYYGKTASYKTVLISTPQKNRRLVGHFVTVKITSAQAFGLEGILV